MLAIPPVSLRSSAASGIPGSGTQTAHLSLDAS